MKTLKINRKIDSSLLQIDELNNWIGKEVDIIIKEKKTDVSSPVDFEAADILSKFKNADLIEKEESGWIKAVREKHGNT